MIDTDVTRVDEPRGDDTPEWEVFLREDSGEPLRHVGSVSAPTASVAHEQASALFGRTATGLWLCPAAEVERVTDRDLGSPAGTDARTAPEAAGDDAGGAGP